MKWVIFNDSSCKNDKIQTTFPAVLLHHIGAQRGISLLFFFFLSTKAPDGLLRQRQPNLQADLLHTSDGFAPFSPPQSDHIKAPPPPLPHPGSLPCGATLLMDRIRHQNNKAVHERGTMYWRWEKKKCSHFSLPQWPLSNTGVTWRAGEPSNRRVLSHETSRPTPLPL